MFMDAVALVAALTTPHCAAEIQEFPKAVAWLQIRSDLIGDIPADWLRSYFPGKLLYTLQTYQTGDTFDRSMSQPGELHIGQPMADYGIPAIRPVRELDGMVGTNIFQTPSPRLHNSAYRMLAHPALCLPFHVECFEDFWQEMVESGTLDE